ncbi:MAG: ABC transporter substrate-binding protein [Propionibacteriaceae bacterium]|nr:ABC transporter substrate-binding protein [Propionibacteriaceae bacterium]
MQLTKKALLVTAVGLSAALALTGCSKGTSSNTGGASGTPNGASNIVIGTTDTVVSIDPAGSYDNGSLSVEEQVYQFLYTFIPGQSTPQPDAAQSCSFTKPTVFTCTLKPNLKFANGDPLTSADVKFSFDRVLKINSAVGPASLLGNLASIDTPDATTVNFNLKLANDQTFLQVLTTSAGPIVDSKVFSPTSLMSDEAIVKANAFSGPYTITTYNKNQLIQFKPNPDYNGALGKVANGGITLQYFTDETNMKLALTNKTLDMVTRSLTPTDIQSLQKNSNIHVWNAKSGEIRYIVFNLNTMPGNSDAQKLAIRQAIASSIDRNSLAQDVYLGQYTPLCSYVPSGYPGANTAVCDAYPLSTDKAKQYLSAAGISTPVALNIEYNPDHYGSSSDQEYGRIKQQLEATGLFTVNLQSANWTTYNTERTQDAYPIFQLGWFPDYPDADNYLSPFFTANSFLAQHFNEPDIFKAISDEATQPDNTQRMAQIEQIQTDLATKYLPTIPLLQGSMWAFTQTNINGVALMPNSVIPYAALTKS